jgi:glycerol-3-phosphate acyltransferase PlsY
MAEGTAGVTVWHLVAVVAGYVLGSVPFGLILTRLAGLGDIRAIGSGNIGATNVLRTGNRPLALATLLLDGGKGAVAALAMGRWGTDCALLAGLAAVIGHTFPIWLGFRGGKGVATTLGVVLALSWPAGLAAAAIWAGTAALFRYSSLAALVMLASLPLLMLVFAETTRAAAATFLGVLGIARHHANIGRLLRGAEPKIGANGSAGSDFH